MSHILYGPDGRAFTKTQIEEEANALRQRYAGGIVSPMFAGAHPQLEGFGERVDPSLLSTFIRPRFVGSDEHADSSYAQVISNVPGAFNERFAKRNPIADLNKPRDIAGIVTLAMRYWEENYIVNRAIRIKKNFARKQLTILGTPTQRDFYTKQFRRLKMSWWINYIFMYYFLLGRVVVYWGEDFPIEGLCILDPRQIIVRRFLNKSKVVLRPDPRWVNIFQRSNYSTPEFKFLKQNIPSSWVKYIKQNEEIPLKDDTYALIENDLSLFSVRGLADYTINGIPISAAFDALQTHKMLMAGDFSVAWMIKNLIALISIGDPKNEKDYKPPDQIALQKLEAAFQRPEYALNAFVDPTVNIRYIYPDTEILSNKKYIELEKQIEYVLGVPGVFTSSGAGEDFASGSLSLKPFREDIECARQDVIDQFFGKLLPLMRQGFSQRKTGGNSDPELEFDNDCLKDDKVLQSEMNDKWDRGAISNRSLLEGKSRDFDTELKRKQEEQQYKGTLAPLYDAHHGPMDGGDGRPNGSGKATNEGTTSAQPRPSRPK